VLAAIEAAVLAAIEVAHPGLAATLGERQNGGVIVGTCDASVKANDRQCCVAAACRNGFRVEESLAGSGFANFVVVLSGQRRTLLNACRSSVA
jgi:hypothetical protein